MRRISILTVSLLILLGVGNIAFADIQNEFNYGDYFGNDWYIYRLTSTPTPFFPGAVGYWDWYHTPIPGPIPAASLSITAYDVDSLNEFGEDTSQGDPGGPEQDGIYAQDGAGWILLGYLAGLNDQITTTSFNIPAVLFDDINNGLHVAVIVDELNNLGYPWAVRIDQSELTVVPEPATMLLLGSGLLGLAGFARRRFRK